MGLGLIEELKSLRDFNDSVKLVLERKGYLEADCWIAVKQSGEYREYGIHISYKPINSDTESKYFSGREAEGFDESVADLIEWLDTLEDAGDAHRKDLIRQMEAITVDMEACGYEGASAIVAAIMEPLRTNLLEKK